MLVMAPEIVILYFMSLRYMIDFVMESRVKMMYEYYLRKNIDIDKLILLMGIKNQSILGHIYLIYVYYNIYHVNLLRKSSSK